MKFILLRVVLVVCFFGQFNSTYSQLDSSAISCSIHCVCSNDPTPAGVMISHVHKKKEWMTSYRYMSMGMSDILKGTESVNQNEVFVNYLMVPDKMRMDMHMFMGMYGITDRLTTMFMFNYMINTMEMSMFPTATMNMPGMNMNSSSTSSSVSSMGISDFKFHLMYGLIDQDNHQLLLSAGVCLPIGSIQLKGMSDDMMYSNNRLPYAMQLGSGTVDFLPCVNYLFKKNKMTFSSQLSANVRSTTNSIGYNLGNGVVSNTWFAYNWLENLSSSIRLEGVGSTSIRGYDKTLYAFNELSANPVNYGGTKINVLIGSSYKFKSRLLKRNRLCLEYGIPIYQKLNGMQMKTHPSLFTSWSITL